ncbi:MAG: hypothetical protein LQ338_007338 [Usnochroma carphineum]|nr:MAG: hypothetical protein LQ338_007338 [Usnochroma carphineum]
MLRWISISTVQTSIRADDTDIANTGNDDLYLPFDRQSTAEHLHGAFVDGASGRTRSNSSTRSNSQNGNSGATSARALPIKHRSKLSRQNPSAKNREPWQSQKTALKTKFSCEGWAPRKRLSPDALEGIRALHTQFPNKYTTPVLADQFQVSPEAIRRILKSKWRPNEEETASRRVRWDKRGERIWSKMVALGVKPPRRWREASVEPNKIDRGNNESDELE